MDGKFIIFGSGMLGHEMLEALGNENVVCFCDNNPAFVGSEKYGKKVIAFDKLKEKYSDSPVVICADMRKGWVYEIAKQCERNGIQDYFSCWSVRGEEIFGQQEKLLRYLGDRDNRMSLKNDLYTGRARGLRRQVDYLKRHTDIRHMKPAGGTLRERQLMLVKMATDLFDKMKELDIRPFLFAGNLLGYVRHNGFIPWDDDIDFALMRNEYERLREFCRLHIYAEEEFDDREKCDKDVREELRNYFWTNGGGDEFNICQKLPDGSKVSIDFFVLDYYASDYTYEALMQKREEVKLRLNNAISENAGGVLYDDAKRIKCFQEAVMEMRPNLAEESENIYFGIDCMNLYFNFHRGCWIPKDVVFPLKKVLYEGAHFYVPNDAEEFAKFQYRDIWELPDDLGIPQHIGSILAGEKDW